MRHESWRQIILKKCMINSLHNVQWSSYKLHTCMAYVHVCFGSQLYSFKQRLNPKYFMWNQIMKERVRNRTHLLLHNFTWQMLIFNGMASLESPVNLLFMSLDCSWTLENLGRRTQQREHANQNLLWDGGATHCSTVPLHLPSYTVLSIWPIPQIFIRPSLENWLCDWSDCALETTGAEKEE